ncbi:hypothetical protein BV25DRAFT_1995583 [Artomyces pyxidatus]|uniref:Uncharacterized protein n=1 Tax=Artomyces pyxidatus TaxID=48021 RepID=A0ACB8SIV3_9AGAM|nr:hypothetical protein BV25DRAFT_1995583 [Artomyces pyxidatus]
MSQPSSTSTTPSPARSGRFVLHDPIFNPWKAKLRGLTYVASFVGLNDSEPLQMHPYPRWASGDVVLPGDLADYFEVHDWTLPFCFCSMKGGPARHVRLFIPGNPSGEHFNQPVIACNGFHCSYWVNLDHLVYNNLGLPTAIFAPRTSRIHVDRPFSTSRDATPSAHTSPQPPQLAGAVELAPQIDAMNVEAPPAPPPSQLQGGFSLKRARSGSLSDPPADKGLISDLSRLWSPPPRDLIRRRVSDVAPLGPSEVYNLLYQLSDPEIPGIYFQDLIRLLAKCPDCKLIMVPHLLAGHRCVSRIAASMKRGSSSSAGMLGNARVQPVAQAASGSASSSGPRKRVRAQAKVPVGGAKLKGKSKAKFVAAEVIEISD